MNEFKHAQTQKVRTIWKFNNSKKKCEICGMKKEDVTALKGDVTILPDLLYTDYLLFLEQPELAKNFKNSLIWAILL